MGITLDPSAPTLADLIQDRKGKRTYSRLSIDCGGFPAGRRIQQLVATEMKAFPDKDTIMGLSRGLGVSNTDVLLACARSLGIPVASQEKDTLAIAGAGVLPDSAQEAIVTVAREMRNLVAHGVVRNPVSGRAELRSVF